MGNLEIKRLADSHFAALREVCECLESQGVRVFAMKSGDLVTVHTHEADEIDRDVFIVDNLCSIERMRNKTTALRKLIVIPTAQGSAPLKEVANG